MPSAATQQIVLVRYGVVPEVARFRCEVDAELPRGTSVVVRTHRGLLVGRVLEVVRGGGNVDAGEAEVVRIATEEDQRLAGSLREAANADFPSWIERIREWNVEVDLVDLECTLDGEKWILYVLSGRGPGTTQLALQAAAHGHGIVEVQPVVADGPVQLEQGGCGSGGCSH